jgi:hypothetical protein
MSIAETEQNGMGVPQVVEEAIVPKRLDRFKVALAKAEQADHRLHHVRCPHSLRNRQSRINHHIQLSSLATLANQRQARIRGQIQLGSLTDFEASHVGLGERLADGIVSTIQ